ncbi:LMA2L protein, partial [Phaetusa simplex]|nr:LMA2L protein [Phaetusa simplex]
MVRNLNHDTFLVIRYVKRRLTVSPACRGRAASGAATGLREPLLSQVLIDIDGKHEWRDCIDVPGVRLPRGYYFGTSSVTGDLSDNHDIISLKLYQLTVERTPEEEKRDREVYLPVVDNLKLPGMEAPLEPMSGLALFLIVFFSLVAIVFAIVIGVIVYNKWQEQSRKHFY